MNYQPKAIDTSRDWLIEVRGKLLEPSQAEEVVRRIHERGEDIVYRGNILGMKMQKLAEYARKLDADDAQLVLIRDAVERFGWEIVALAHELDRLDITCIKEVWEECYGDAN
jgi:hypothetical protein